jgi:hypothetical protein
MFGKNIPVDCMCSLPSKRVMSLANLSWATHRSFELLALSWRHMAVPHCASRQVSPESCDILSVNKILSKSPKHYLQLMRCVCLCNFSSYEHFKNSPCSSFPIRVSTSYQYRHFVKVTAAERDHHFFCQKVHYADTALEFLQVLKSKRVAASGHATVH